MVWDKTKPLGSEVLRWGDNRIRELKADLEFALQLDHEFPVDVNAVKLIPKVVASNTPPIDVFTGRIYFNTLPHLQTFVIYTGTAWEVASNNFHTLPNGTIFPAICSAPFIQTYSLVVEYAVRISNVWLSNVSTGGSENCISITHNHGNTYGCNLPSHSHSMYTETGQAIGGDCDSGGIIERVDDLASGTHTHPVNIELHGVDLSHEHTVGSTTINLNYAVISLKQVVL